MDAARLGWVPLLLVIGCGASAGEQSEGAAEQVDAAAGANVARGAGGSVAPGAGGSAAPGAGGSAAPGAGGSAPPGAGGSAPPGDSGVPIAACGDPVSPGLPPNAPVLAPGVWTNISPPGVAFSSDPNVNAKGMALDPCDRATLYLCVSAYDPPGAKAGLYKTTDAGATWTKIGPLDEPWRIRVDPNDRQHLYAGDGVRGGTMGFWVSSDGGVTWAKPKGWSAMAASLGITSSSGMDDVYDIAVDPADFGHVLVSFHSPWTWGDSSKGAGIVESTDGGDTWKAHAWPNDRGYGHGVWFLKNSSTWLWGTQGSGYQITTDSGATWSQVTTGNMAHGGGGVYIAKTGVVYSSAWDELMRSTDDGRTWSKVGPTALKYTTSVIGDGTRLYAQHAGGPGTFYTSPETDGITWTPYDAGAQTIPDGPFEMAFDEVNQILYSSSWAAGMWALKVK